jgi:hypothetical protein
VQHAVFTLRRPGPEVRVLAPPQPIDAMTATVRAMVLLCAQYWWRGRR